MEYLKEEINNIGDKLNSIYDYIIIPEELKNSINKIKVFFTKILVGRTD